MSLPRHLEVFPLVLKNIPKFIEILENGMGDGHRTIFVE